MEQIRDLKLNHLSEKIKNLDFWKDIKYGEITSPEVSKNQKKKRPSMLPKKIVGPVQHPKPEKTLPPFSKKEDNS